MRCFKLTKLSFFLSLMLFVGTGPLSANPRLNAGSVFSALFRACHLRMKLGSQPIGVPEGKHEAVELKLKLPNYLDLARTGKTKLPDGEVVSTENILNSRRTDNHDLAAVIKRATLREQISKFRPLLNHLLETKQELVSDSPLQKETLDTIENSLKSLKDGDGEMYNLFLNIHIYSGYFETFSESIAEEIINFLDESLKPYLKNMKSSADSEQVARIETLIPQVEQQLEDVISTVDMKILYNL